MGEPGTRQSTRLLNLCPYSWTRNIVTLDAVYIRERSQSVLGTELNYSPALLYRKPFLTFREPDRNVKLNNLCHSSSPSTRLFPSRRPSSASLPLQLDSLMVDRDARVLSLDCQTNVSQFMTNRRTSSDTELASIFLCCRATAIARHWLSEVLRPTSQRIEGRHWFIGMLILFVFRNAPLVC